MKASLKDTGIQWLGKIPKEWTITKVKKHCKVLPSNVDKKENEDETEVSLCNYVDVYYNDFITKSLNFMKATASEGEIKKFQLNVGDVIITKDSEDPNDIGVAAIVKETFDHFLCGYHLSIIRSFSEVFEPRFLNWCLNDYSIASQLHREATGVTRWAIASRHVKSSTIPLPPPTEQKAIADYLDRATKKIDRVIAIKKQQLKQIEGYFHTKLYEVITRGLNESSFKQGNNAYMDEVPNSWIIDRIKDVCEFNPAKSSSKYSSEELVSVYPMEFISDDGRVLGVNKLSHEEIDTGLNYFENGDVIFAKITPCMENGKGAYMTEIPTRVAFGSTEFFVLRPTFRVLGKFLYYATRNLKFRQYLEANMKGAAGQQRVPSKFFQFCEIAFPKDKDHQQNIIDYLDDLKLKTDKLLEKTHKQMGILQAYRQSLIHECVTGKKRVVEKAASSKKEVHA